MHILSCPACSTPSPPFTFLPFRTSSVTKLSKQRNGRIAEGDRYEVRKSFLLLLSPVFSLDLKKDFVISSSIVAEEGYIYCWLLSTSFRPH
ncbi:unnamed protein product [Periconia digitata]|uniref:Uncharacterized protein n=1 Tax=Periconia digitata TaxID=1303443 RepID=A0A9W4UDN4_9PLEO|nr:unnamed protein product [Periconia digitata]